MAYLRLDIEPHITPSARLIGNAVDILHAGGVAAYPTDSVYALGCAIEAKRAVDRIYRARQMPSRQKLALICPNISTAATYAHFSQTAYQVAKRIFPGPYTLVVPATREVPRLLLDKRRRRTVGIRIPDHPIAQALVNALGRPLLSSSAIPPGEDDPCRDADEVIDAFGGDVDVVIDGGPAGDLPSTVIEIIDDDITVLRHGRGPVDDILE